MIVLCLGMQLGEDIIEHANGKCHALHSSMQEEDILDDTNAKCHFCIL